MKRIAMFALTLCAFAFSAQAQSGLGDIIGKIGEIINKETVGEVVNTVTDILTGAKLDEAALVGDWNYKGSAVVFESENVLTNAGGVIAAKQVESKLDENLQKIGIIPGKFSLSLAEDKTAVMKYAGKTYKGTWTFDQETKTLNMKLGLFFRTNCIVAKNGQNIELLWQADKMLALIKKLSGRSQNATIKLISEVAKQYDQMRVGFELTKNLF